MGGKSMATRRLSPRNRSPSLAQLAYGIVTEAFRESFETLIKATVKHHPRSRSYSRQFLRAWRAKLEWAERSQAINERGAGGATMSTPLDTLAEKTH
jgi:hypothetical protein